MIIVPLVFPSFALSWLLPFGGEGYLKKGAGTCVNAREKRVKKGKENKFKRANNKNENGGSDEMPTYV
jgi:hypothetical protein